MLSSYRPLIYTFDLTPSFGERYAPFFVYAGTTVYDEDAQNFDYEYTPLYSGKTWCSTTANGATTTINATDIARAYAWRQELKFDESAQQWRLVQFTDFSDRLNPPVLKPIERWDEPRLLNCDLVVDVGNPQSAFRYPKSIETFLPTKDVLRYDNVRKTYFDGWEQYMNIDYLYKHYTDILPEYPIKMTSNYFICFDWAQYGYNHGQTVSITSGPMNDFTINVEQYGNYSVAMDLRTLISAFPYRMVGALYFQHEHKDNIQFAKLDNCYHDYYIGFMLPTGAWFSWGFEDRHLVRSNDSSKEAIQTLYDTERLVRDTERYTFSLSRQVNRETARVLQTLGCRGAVYVYNTKNDVGIWCNVETSNFELGNAGLIDFSVDLKVSEIYTTLL